MDNILFDITPNFKTILCALSRKLSIKRVQFVYGTLKLDIFLFSRLYLLLLVAICLEINLDQSHNSTPDPVGETPTEDDVHDDLDSLPESIPPQPELCEDSDDEENASDEENAQPEPCVTPTRSPRPVLEQGYNGVCHYPCETTPPLFDSPSFPSWKAAHDEEYGRKKYPTSNVSTPQSTKSQHWYKDSNQKTHVKYRLDEDPRNLFKMKRLRHVEAF